MNLNIRPDYSFIFCRFETVLKIVERENIDCDKWNRLVSSQKDSSFYSCSWYLDATAENWCILIDDEYNNGIALPYTKRLNTEFLYTPIFVTYLEVFGKIDLELAEQLIMKRFSRIDFCVKQPFLTIPCQEFVCQKIDRNYEIKTSIQANRNINKAIRNNLRCSVITNYKKILGIIHDELTGKYNGLDEKSLNRLNHLFPEALKRGMIRVFEINDQGRICGGIICICNDRQLLYVKGTVFEDDKKKGAMYLALHEAIKYARENGLNIDFGGSRVEGVRRFNLNLGGTDDVFYNYKVDNSPFWFRVLSKIYMVIKKRS